MMLTVEYRKKPLPMEEEKDGPSLVLTQAVVRAIDRLQCMDVRLDALFE
jgi:hypothetical protein